MDCIGIDVSKQTLVVFDGTQEGRFPNLPGLELFRTWLKERFPQGTASPVLIFEPTGPYSHELVLLCARERIRVHILNPKRSHHFRAALGRRSKNDPVDARTLYAYHVLLPETEFAIPAPNPQAETLRHHLNAYQLVQNSRIRFVNHLEAARQEGNTPQLLLEELTAEVQHQQQREEMLLRTAIDWVEQQPELGTAFHRLQTIPGIGPITALCLLLLELTYPGANRQELTALVGLDPRERQSGTCLHLPRHISKNGQALARRLLYLAALSAARNQPHFLSPFYCQLVARGKHKKQALIAVARKLLLVAHAVYCSEEPFRAAGVREGVQEVIAA
jgi:transposase